MRKKRMITILMSLGAKLSTNVGHVMGAGIIAFFAPISILFHLILFLVALDLVTAIAKCFKQDNEFKGIEKFRIIKSRKLRRTVIKLFVYQLLIAAAYFFSIAIFQGDWYIANFVAGSIALVEMTSIAENCDVLTGQNIFTGMIKKIKTIFESKIDKGIEKPE